MEDERYYLNSVFNDGDLGFVSIHRDREVIVWNAKLPEEMFREMVLFNMFLYKIKGVRLGFWALRLALGAFVFSNVFLRQLAEDDLCPLIGD
jgi:hypothetical protein